MEQLWSMFNANISLDVAPISFESVEDACNNSINQVDLIEVHLPIATSPAIWSWSRLLVATIRIIV